ncbi:MAG: hypothetical protein IT189_10615 [Microbacteriaceae bacterium]|nr:hypothetical protein [Microbacteriaceae bacterium]
MDVRVDVAEGLDQLGRAVDAEVHATVADDVLGAEVDEFLVVPAAHALGWGEVATGVP